MLNRQFWGRTAKRYLNTLVKQGLIEFKGAPKTGGYYLK